MLLVVVIAVMGTGERINGSMADTHEGIVRLRGERKTVQRKRPYLFRGPAFLRCLPDQLSDYSFAVTCALSLSRFGTHGVSAPGS